MLLAALREVGAEGRHRDFQRLGACPRTSRMLGLSRDLDQARSLCVCGMDSPIHTTLCSLETMDPPSKLLAEPKPPDLANVSICPHPWS